MRNYWGLILAVWCAGQHVHGQDVLTTADKITIGDLSDDRGKYAFATGQAIYLMEVTTMQLVDSFAYRNSERMWVSQLEVAPSGNAVIYRALRPKNLGTVITEIVEYPNDSLYIYNFTTKQTTAVAGNVYVGFGRGTDQYIIGYNEYSSYEGQFFPVRGGGLTSYPDNIAMPSSGTIRRLRLAPGNQQLAVVYFDGYSEDFRTANYRLELRSFPQLDSLASVAFTSPKLTEVLFSERGDYVAVMARGSGLGGIDQQVVFTCPGLEKLDEWPSDLEIYGRIEQGTIWKLADGEIVNDDLRSGERRYQIWPGITKFASIEGFTKLNDDELLIFGTANQHLGNTRNGIQRFSLRDNALYGQMEAGSPVDTLLNPDKIQIQDNVLFRDGTGRISAGVDKSRLLIQRDALLQVWSTEDRRKLYQLTFDHEFKAFMGADGTKVLVLGHEVQKNYNEWTLNMLDITTGISNKKRFADNPYGFFSFSSSCDCVAVPDRPATWFCTDFGSQLWKIDGDSLTVTAVQDLGQADFDFSIMKNLYRLPESDRLAVNLALYNNDSATGGTTDEVYSPVYLYEPGNETVMRFDQLQGIARYYPYSEQQIVFVRGGELVLADLADAGVPTRSLMPLDSGELEDVLVDGQRAYVVVRLPGDFSMLAVYVFDNQSDRLVAKHELPYHSARFIDPTGLHYIADEGVHTVDLQDTVTTHWKSKRSLFTQAERVSYDGDQRILFDRELLIDLKTLDIERRLPSYKYPVLLKGDDNRVLFIASERYGEDTHFRFVIAKAGELEAPIWTSEAFKPKGDGFSDPDNFRLSPDGGFAIAFSSSSLVNDRPRAYYVIDLANQTVREERAPATLANVTFAADGSCYELLMPGVGSSSYLAVQDSTLAMDKVYVYETATGARVRMPRDVLAARIYGHVFPVVNFDMVLLQDYTDGQATERAYYANEYLSIARWYDDLQLIVAGSQSGNVFVWDRDNQSPRKKIHVGFDNVVRIDRMQDKLFVLMNNSEIKIVDLGRLALDATLSITQDTLEQKAIAWFTPDGYFKASKEQLRDYHFVKGLETFPISSYELFLNRPDVVMERVGFSDRSSIALYHEAYQRRLNRYGVASIDDFLVLERPEIELDNAGGLPASVADRQLQLNLHIRSELAAIKSVTVYVNGVPASVYEALSGPAITADVVLNAGPNNISVIALGVNGIESEPVGATVFNRQPATSERVHYLGIGVSDYRDSTMNLRYATKDIRAMVDYLGMRYDGRFHLVDTLMDTAAVRQRVLDARQQLMATDVDDVVIISLSGHGLVDEENQFFFATHDLDFKAPQELGLSYADIQYLLDGIPARRKLVLLDACHSGEIDEDTIGGVDPGTTIEVAEDVVAVQARGSKAIGTKKSKNNSFDVMRSLFYDFDRGNGAYVISAAGGREYAYEGEDWSNGVFTYSVIQAFQELGYDTFSGRVPFKVSGLKSDVYRRVNQLTKGRQQPTARSENIEWDWSF